MPSHAICSCRATQKEYIAQTNESAIVSAKRIAAKYNCHGAHSDAISEFACTLFDKFKNLHGLSSDKKIILQLASILHSCGQYINVRMPNQCSFDLIKNLDIFGLTHEQILLTAFVAGSDEFTMPNVADAGAIPMTEERRLEILKLVAIFRLANALDKSKRRKLRISKIRITTKSWRSKPSLRQCPARKVGV